MGYIEKEGRIEEGNWKLNDRINEIMVRQSRYHVAPRVCCIWARIVLSKVGGISFSEGGSMSKEFRRKILRLLRGLLRCMGVLIWGEIVLVFRIAGKWFSGWRDFLLFGGWCFIHRKNWGRIRGSKWGLILARGPGWELIRVQGSDGCTNDDIGYFICVYDMRKEDVRKRSFMWMQGISALCFFDLKEIL